MTMPGSRDLLLSYLNERSEAAFSALVRHYLNLVYPTALRRTGDAHAAEDISQSVLNTVTKRASTLVDHPNFSGWLYTTTRNLAEKARRTEQRRRMREQKAYAMQQLTLNESVKPEWDRVRPLLDDAMSSLNDADRKAVKLGFQRAVIKMHPF